MNNNWENQILVYDTGTFIGLATTRPKTDGEIELITVDINGSKADVLHLVGMNYGIVVPKKLSDKLNGGQ